MLAVEGVARQPSARGRSNPYVVGETTPTHHVLRLNPRARVDSLAPTRRPSGDHSRSTRLGLGPPGLKRPILTSAIVLTALVLGRGALRKLLGGLLIWRVDPRWYLVVVLGPVALAGGMIAFNAFVGDPAISVGVPLLTVVITLAFFIFPGSALGEEIGWRGYALPRLQSGRSALSASLILGVIWAFYHLPLFFTGQAFRSPSLLVPFVVSGLALSVILSWVYNSTGGSLLLVVVLHAAANLEESAQPEATTAAPRVV